MTAIIPASFCAVFLAALPAQVRAQASSAPEQAEWGSAIPDDPAAPSEKAPTPDVKTPGPEQRAPDQPYGTAEAEAAPAGQWVYTAQYGWVWMPYSSAYTYAPPGVAEPYMYVYGPEFGWAWVGAPWVWGWGPGPYFGVYGSFRFGWRHPGYAWWGWGHPRWYGHGGFGPRFYGHGGFGHRLWGGAGPAPHRGFVGAHPGGSGGTRGVWGGGRGSRR